MTQVQQPEALERLRDMLNFTHARHGKAERFVEVDARTVLSVIGLAEQLQARIAELEAAPAAQAVEPVEVELPDVEDMAHSALEESLSGGVGHDVFHRWMRAVMDKTVAALRAAPAPAAVAVPDTVLAHLDGLLDDAAAHIYPSDLRKFQKGECTATVASVRMGNRDEKSVPLFSREQVAEALAATPPAQTGSNRYCGAGMCVTTDNQHAPGCTAAPQAQDVQRDADMFLDSQDGERFGHDITSIIEECDDGAVVKIARAQSLPIITVRVIQTDDGCDYEVLDDAAIAASAAQKGGEA